MKNKKYILGIDVGATSVKTGLINNNGKIISKSSFITKRSVARSYFIKGIIDYVNAVKLDYKITNRQLKGIGIGLPGTVDYDKGIVHNLTNIKNWHEVPLKKILTKNLKLPVFLDNDANAFANGQLVWGAARNAKNAICITLGSGVGGGLIINQDLYRGSNFSAGEIGHICIDTSGPKCGCGSNGCLEAFVGNSYIIKGVIKKIKQGKKTSLVKMVEGKLPDITPEIIAKAAKKKDALSLSALKETGTYLGVGLSSLVNVLNPDRIVIGGGVSKAGELIFKHLKNELSRRAMKQHLKILKIVKAEFLEEAGVIGAASLVK